MFSGPVLMIMVGASVDMDSLVASWQQSGKQESVLPEQPPQRLAGHPSRNPASDPTTDAALLNRVDVSHQSR